MAKAYISRPIDTEDKPKRIGCQLLPIGFLLPATLIISALSFLSWYFAAGDSSPALISVLCGIIWIPVLLSMALELNIVVSPYGIEARNKLHSQSLFGRVVRPWTDLHSVRLRRLKSTDSLLERLNRAKGRVSHLERPRSIVARLLERVGKGWWQQGFLVLDFKSGGSIPFPLAGFSPDGLDDLFLSLTRWADPMSLNPDVIALQRDVLTGTAVNVAPSYTHMWEESLRQRFEATNFVPLAGGEELRSGSLKVLLLLACGGQSSAYLVSDKRGDRFVVKELAAAIDDDSTLSKLHEMFAREASILAKLDHPNIVRLVDNFVENQRDYLLLDFVAGMSLRQYVEMHGAFSEDDVLKVAKTLARILIYLHGQDPPVIHRDLSPDNFVIREYDKEVVLIDFGAANEFVGKVTGTMIGKQCYIPPEQFRGHAVPQSDLYAAGATLYYLLTGKDPLPISCSIPHATIPHVSPTLDTLIQRLTAIEVPERLQSAEQMLALLEGPSMITTSR